MNLSKFRVNAAAIEQGVWIKGVPGMDDLELRVRGVDNADWKRLNAKLRAAVPLEKRLNGQLDPVEAENILGELLASACLLDWRGLIGDDGEPVAYSADKARELLFDPNYRPFRDTVLTAASMVAEHVAEDEGAAAKN